MESDLFMLEIGASLYIMTHAFAIKRGEINGKREANTSVERTHNSSKKTEIFEGILLDTRGT